MPGVALRKGLGSVRERATLAGVAGYFTAYLLPLTVLMGAHWRGGWAYATPLFAFVVVPLLDIALPPLRFDRTPSGNSGAGWRLLPLRLWAPVQCTVTVWALSVLFGHPFEAGLQWNRELAVPISDMLGLCLSVGITAGAGGINVAHELMHRARRSDRRLAHWLMSVVSYPQFCLAHVHGHHRDVATDRDPASAKRGDTVYGFVWRSAVGAFRVARNVSGSRGDSRALFSLGRTWALAALAYVAVFLCWGIGGVLFWVAQSVVAIVLLEVINYAEHYGLRRRADAEGVLERVGPQHAWNSRCRMSNWILFNLPLHSNHHVHASKPYWQLRPIAGAPELPGGYSAMLLASFLPPLFWALMHPRLDALQSSRPTST